MFKKIQFKGLNYRDLDRFDSHDLKRDKLHSYYQGFDFLELLKSWPQIVGPKMAPHTSPLKMTQDSLFIITRHSVYSQELSYLSEAIKAEIFKIFPQLRPVIKKLVFQTKETYFHEQEKLESKKVVPPKLHPQSPQYKIHKAAADKLFEHIEDQELRQMMISLYIQSR
jgi:hypothetical protein